MIYHGDAYQYVKETPSVLREIMNHQETIFAECMEYFREKDIQEIYLAGSGSSFHSALAAAPFMRGVLGIPVNAVSPSDFMEQIDMTGEKSLLIGISQQGTSMGVIRALDAMRRRKGMAVSCTGEYETEITRHVEANFYVECGIEDAGATTKGYTATMLTLCLLGLWLARACGRIGSDRWRHYYNEVQDSVDMMESILRADTFWYEKQAEKLAGCKDLVILTDVKNKTLLPEIVLKFSETCRFPVRGYEAEDFMHGMYNAVDETTQFLCLFGGEKESEEHLGKLFGYYQKKGNQMYGMNAGMGDGFSDYFIKGNTFSILEYILPIQILFISVSRKRGIDLNIPKDPEFHKYMQSKMET